MKCQKCGREIANDSKFCEFCGAEVKKNQVGKTSTVESKNSREWIYIVFAVILISLVGYVLYEHSKLSHALDSARVYQEKVSTNEKVIDSLQNVISQTDDKILLVSDDNFGDFDSISFQHLVIIDYYGKWCEPCRRLDPALYEVVKKYHGQLIVGRYIVDDFKEKYVKQYNVTGIPTLLFLQNGREVNRIVGYCEKQTIENAIDSALQVGNSVPVAEPQSEGKNDEYLGASGEAKLRAEAERKKAGQEQKIAKRKNAEEKKKIRESEKRKYIEQGYVDLGLPSGTLWKNKNEEGGFYTYEQAVEKFGSSLPTKEQLKELKSYCRWTWTGNGYKVEGSSGGFVFLPTAGSRGCDGSVSGVGSVGFYRSSTPYGSYSAWGLYLNSDEVIATDFSRCSGFSVRLAVQP